MDAMLRVRHDSLVAEFSCSATELRVVKTAPGSLFSRSIGAFCNDRRATYFDRELPAFAESCASCAFHQRAEIDDEPSDPERPAAD
jgi:hypothetical protein